MGVKRFLLILLFRLLIMFFTDTWFVPDEYFQCTEVAYKRVFEKGHLSWEWDPQEPIRSVLHPYFIAGFYRIFAFFGGDSQNVIRLLPNVIHAVMFAISDIFYLKLLNRIFFANPRGKAFTLILYGTNWFIIYCSSRTLANTVELCLTIIALNWYPLYLDEINPRNENDKRRQKSFIPYMVLGTLSIVIRPTAGIIWGFLGLRHLYLSKSKFRLILTAIFSVGIPLFITVLIDSDYQTPLKFPLYNFLKFNVLTNGSKYFGVHPWYWYIIDGLLLTSTGTYFLSIGGYILQRDNELNRSPPIILFDTSILYMIIHSLLPHKEHRFILPILGLIFPFAGLFLQYLSTKISKITKGLIFLIIVINIFSTIFFCRIHQRGVIDATKDISKDISIKSPKTLTHVIQLMPCYSMPQYAYFHKLKVKHHMLDCTPNLKNLTDYIDESDLFHQNPIKFFTPTKREELLLFKYSYVVIFKKTYQKMSSILKETGYRVWRTYQHTPVPISDNQDNVLLVLKRSSNAT